jgi:hypothetical protein
VPVFDETREGVRDQARTGLRGRVSHVGGRRHLDEVDRNRGSCSRQPRGVELIDSVSSSMSDLPDYRREGGYGCAQYLGRPPLRPQTLEQSPGRRFYVQIGLLSSGGSAGLAARQGARHSGASHASIT